MSKKIKRPVPLVDLHPITKKLIKKGHPWVIKDEYTGKFNPKSLFLMGKDKDEKEGDYLLLHDPDHPKIKARLWSYKKPLRAQVEDFPKELERRLIEAYDKRLPYLEEREALYLCFGEADFLPGLFILKLKTGFIIQSYSAFWFKNQEVLARAMKRAYKNLDFTWASYQERNQLKKQSGRTLWGKVPSEIIVKELGLNYLIKPEMFYDIGIYSDMAAIRKELAPYFKEKVFLNLFSYTGAYSLFALSQGAEKCINIDLSSAYLSWGQKNLDLNDSLPKKIEDRISHVDKALMEMKKNQETVDFILCDPPSSSSDGRKTSQAFKEYEKRIKLMDSILNPGGMMALFLNTHGISRKKFNDKMKSYSEPLKLEWIKELGLKEDCPRIRNFPEGDYLKGILFQKMK